MKVILDECITRGPAKAIIAHLKENENVDGGFLLDLPAATTGMQNGHWVAHYCLPPKERWLIISLESGRSAPRVRAKGPPLYLVTAREGVTAFFLCGPKFGNAPSHLKVARIVSLIPEMLRLHALHPAGTRFKVTARGLTKFECKVWPVARAP